ncbi:uncharacterized protein LOC125494160 [Beta vulgaris subsp. vulgaris]|uniref:uncharacterized protein LOC125494160 n=1 Tax=Beta vulgaris subsp. vulgaris TaxID=3555 RepID=UPI0025486C70|nr:uncharacterized protein LOC125494160 [Beta vulgaris subsp. vulgaris]
MLAPKLTEIYLLNLLEAIRVWSMKIISARFDNAIDMESGQLTDYATKVLETRSGESRFCHATPCGGGEFEVTDEHVNFPTNLARLSVGCGKWQGCGIPCKHALRVMYNQRIDPIEYVSDYYKGAAYKATYGHHIHPMADSSQWPDYNLPHIHPPNRKRGAGRPPKQRKRGVNEAKNSKRHNSVKCSKCKHLDHNARTCGRGDKGQKRVAATGTSTSKAQKRARKAT